MKIIAFATGSAIIADVEESAYRAQLQIVAGIRNRPGKNFLSTSISLHPFDNFPADFKSLPFIVPIFTPGYRQIAAREAFGVGMAEAHLLIDPTSIVPRDLECGAGSYINAGAIIGSGSRLDRFVFVNRGASIGHHASIARFASIGPSAIIAGYATIGYGAMIGTGAIVLPSITVGNNAVVGAGAVVTHDVPDECMVLGNPARITKREIGGYRATRVV
jgi:sugar O-acyltransferase (sialic acid O-acetyltransferase NeuD family)